MESSILWHLRHANKKKCERINALVTLPLPKNAAHPTKTWAITRYLQQPGTSRQTVQPTGSSWLFACFWGPRDPA
jgi:hypothetical protein